MCNKDASLAAAANACERDHLTVSENAKAGVPEVEATSTPTKIRVEIDPSADKLRVKN